MLKSQLINGNDKYFCQKNWNICFPLLFGKSQLGYNERNKKIRLAVIKKTNLWRRLAGMVGGESNSISGP